MNLEASFTYQTNEGGYTGALNVRAKTALHRPYSFLCLSFVVPFEPENLKGGTLIERQGDWHKIQLDTPFTQGEFRLEFSGEGDIKKSTDYPEGLYLETEKDRQPIKLNRPLTRLFEDVNDGVLSDQPAFIPRCEMNLSDQVRKCPTAIFFDEGAFNVGWLQRLMHRMELPLSVVHDPNTPAWMISSERVPDLETAFELLLDETGASLRFKNRDGFFVGQAFLFQYLLQWQVRGQLCECSLKGSPKYSYRGIQLDVVRHFFETKQIEEWLDIFALFNYNTFHWHLTDDDGWRVESEAFPAVSHIGAWRGPDEQLPPQMGTGEKRYGGFYSNDDIKSVVARAEEVGMEVIPEMDLPGHARALLKSIPNLIEPNDRSSYRSVQHHDDNVINPAFGQTLEIVKTLIGEWCALFPSRLFHIGCDEVPQGVWKQSPAALGWAEKTGQPVESLQDLFINEIGQYLASKGKTLAGWEEIRTEKTPKDVWVYSWQGTEAGLAAANAGHPVVMTPAQFCYLDLATSEVHDDPGYWWAGTLNLEKAYQYNPESGFSDSARSLIKGVQYCLWTELVQTPAEAEFMWFPRLLAGAQVVWGGNTNDTFESYKSDVETWVQVLIRLGINIRSQKMGW